MHQDKPAWVEHQRKRWTRPNAHLWIRHDAYRFAPPGAPRHVGKDVVHYFWPEHKSAQPAPAQDAGGREDLAAEQAELLRLRSELPAISAELKLRRLLRNIKAYNPNQPRVPAGSREGGQWTEDGAGSGRIRVAQIDRTVTDAEGRPYYRPGGHHEMPEGVSKKWNLQPETQRVFRQSSTGTLGATIRTTPESARQGNVWDGDGGLHRAYNQAVTELSNRFIQANKLSPDASDMTPAHAHALLKEIRESEDPRIRDFNLNMRRIQRLRRLRGGPDE